MGPTDRVVVLIDMDCFYCQVEEKLNPHLKGQPIAVVQYNAWRGGGIIAVNYPARDQGVTRHMRGNDAKQKCPSIKLMRVPQVRGKADLTKYRDAGKEVADVLATFTPLLERASVDEAYLDITELVKERIENNSFDLTVDKLKNTFVVQYELKDYLEIAVTNREFSEDNLKLAIGGLITEEIRQQVYDQTGYKCSAGIAHNKILAKLVCSLHKPNKQTILPNDAIDKFFETMPINKIKSLGGKFGQTLSEDFQIKYMGELKKFTEKQLAHKYDEKTASWLYNIARGVDLEPVTTKLISKSIACCKNFSGIAALKTGENVEHWLNELAEELSERLGKDLKENNRKAKQVIISFTQEINKRDVSSSRTQSLTSYDAKKIGRNACELVKKFCLKLDGSYHIKFLGLNAGNFEDVKNVREITSFFKSGENHVVKLSNNLAENFEEKKCTITNENLDNDVYFQRTQDLEETSDNLLFYDDSFRIKKDNFIEKVSLTSKIPDKENSFFKQYFNQGDNSPEISEKEEPSVMCFDCDKKILQCEYQSHQDYHFALKLSTSENKSTERSISPTKNKNIVNNKKRKAPKNSIKINNNQSLLSFFNNTNVNEELTETCPDCNRKIKIDDIESHKDYHVAKKIHLEINTLETSNQKSSVNNQALKKNNQALKKNCQALKKNSQALKKNNQSVISYFKRA